MSYCGEREQTVQRPWDQKEPEKCESSKKASGADRERKGGEIGGKVPEARRWGQA